MRVADTTTFPKTESNQLIYFEGTLQRSKLRYIANMHYSRQPMGLKFHALKLISVGYMPRSYLMTKHFKYMWNFVDNEI